METVLQPIKKRRRIGNSRMQMPSDIVHLISTQDRWTEEEYLALDDNIGAWMIELVNGRLEVLPMPSPYHQDLVKFLFLLLNAFVDGRRLGRVYFSPLPVRLFPGTFREPDIAFLKKHRIKDRSKPPEGADLVMEIVSPGTDARERDFEDKRVDYAKAKIPEYWIVDPKEKTITVLTLSGKSYKVHGVYKAGDEAASKLLKGFKVAVSDVFAAGDGK
ncbi:MAG: Uma2 family endonuclease [Planctomycetes bacterium]|nr:Uma2 family endonuclease [Planctomycetota bacterium]